MPVPQLAITTYPILKEVISISLVLSSNKSQKLSVGFCKNLFERFREDIEKESNFFFNSKVIRFPVLFFWFSHLRFSKEEARLILKTWVELSYVEYLKFKGIRFREGKLC